MVETQPETVIVEMAKALVEKKYEIANLQAALDAERDQLHYARESIANIEAERDEALRKLALAEGNDNIWREQIKGLKWSLTEAWQRVAQAEGHNKMLRGQNAQLQQRLREMKASIVRQGLAGPTRPEWERTVAENVAAQAIADSAEPQFTAQEQRDAKAIVEEEAEYQRTARGELAQCPACHGTGKMMGIPDAGPCGTCGGTKVVQDDAPKHLDIAREGAADHAMSLDQDTD